MSAQSALFSNLQAFAQQLPKREDFIAFCQQLGITPEQAYQYLEYSLQYVQSSVEKIKQNMPESKDALYNLSKLSMTLLWTVQTMNDIGVLPLIIGTQAAQRSEHAMKLIANTAQLVANAAYVVARFAVTKYHQDPSRAEQELQKTLKNLLKLTYVSPVFANNKYIFKAKSIIVSMLIMPPTHIFSLPEPIDMSLLLKANFQDTWDSVMKYKSERNPSAWHSIFTPFTRFFGFGARGNATPTTIPTPSHDARQPDATVQAEVNLTDEQEYYHEISASQLFDGAEIFFPQLNTNRRRNNTP